MYGFTPESHGAYGTIQIMALDYVYRLWVGMFRDKTKPAAQGETRKVAAPEAPVPQVGATPACCESY